MTARSPLLSSTVISSLFWLGYWLFFVWLLSNFLPYRAAVPIAAVTVAAQAGVAFLNVRYLIPTYLETGRYGRYGLLVLVILIVVPLLAISVNRYAIMTPNLLAGNAPRLYQFARLAFLFLLVILFSTTYALAIHHLRESQRQTEREKAQLSSELNGLKNQVNPHFLFNTLNNLYTLAYLNEPSTAPMILKLSELMRYMLYECRDDTTPLENEVRFLNNLVAMQQLKSDTFTQHLQLTVEGVAPHHRIAPLLLLVFLENSFKHSDLDQNTSGYIHIAIQAGADHQLRFHCVNTKRSAAGEAAEPGGIGLVNVQKRLALIYPNQHTLQIDDQPDRFTVHLILPLT